MKELKEHHFNQVLFSFKLLKIRLFFAQYINVKELRKRFSKTLKIQRKEDETYVG